MSVELRCDFCGKIIPSADDVIIVRVSDHIAFWDFFKLLGNASGNMEKLTLEGNPKRDNYVRSDKKKDFHQSTYATSWCCRERVHAVLSDLDNTITDVEALKQYALESDLVDEITGVIGDFNDNPSADPFITVGRIKDVLAKRYPEAKS